jgi:hypothetical protein
MQGRNELGPPGISFPYYTAQRLELLLRTLYHPLPPVVPELLLSIVLSALEEQHLLSAALS